MIAMMMIKIMMIIIMAIMPYYYTYLFLPLDIVIVRQVLLLFRN